MADGRAASGLDRLPWLADDVDAPPRRSSRGYWIGALLALLAVAATSYWLGWRVSDDNARFDGRPSPRSTLTLPQAQEVQPVMPALPESPTVDPTRVPPMPAIDTAPAVAVEPATPERPPIKAQTPPSKRPSISTSSARDAKPARLKAKAGATPKSKPKDAATPSPWPVRVEEGSAGRLVRIGTFASRRSAKRGWHALMRNNPSLQRLPALVVPVVSARNGRVYYRLQMGTTSQAHSAVLCQRMRMIGQSCVIVPGEKAAA